LWRSKRSSPCASAFPLLMWPVWAGCPTPYSMNERSGAPLLALFARGGCVDRSRRGFAYALLHPDTIVDSNRPLLSILVVAKVLHLGCRPPPSYRFRSPASPGFDRSTARPLHKTQGAGHPSRKSGQRAWPFMTCHFCGGKVPSVPGYLWRPAPRFDVSATRRPGLLVRSECGVG
jgi:hypothetical protein